AHSLRQAEREVPKLAPVLSFNRFPVVEQHERSVLAEEVADDTLLLVEHTLLGDGQLEDARGDAEQRGEVAQSVLALDVACAGPKDCARARALRVPARDRLRQLRLAQTAGAVDADALRLSLVEGFDDIHDLFGTPDEIRAPRAQVPRDARGRNGRPARNGACADDDYAVRDQFEALRPRLLFVAAHVARQPC